MCRSRIRVPDIWWGDYLATLGAVRIGERELLALGNDVGWDRLARHVENWFDYSERRMKAAIKRLPSGTATTTSTHDAFPGAPEGIPVKATVTVDAESARISIDLRANPDCLPCGLNLTEATTRSGGLLGVFNALGDHTIPSNSGSFRRIDVVLRENCAIGIPTHPHSCSVATTNLADRVVSATQSALAVIAAGFGMAEAGPIYPAAGGVISGRDSRQDFAPYVNQVHLGISGGPATPRQDGWLTLIHAGNAGMCRHDGIEVDELSYPMVIHERRVLADTGGAGMFRGAPSIRVEFGPLGLEPMRVFYNADGMINVAKGVRGGANGGPSRVLKRTTEGSLEAQQNCAGVWLAAGESIVSVSSGGGGYGSPAERSEQAILDDVREGYVSAEQARGVFGIVIDSVGAIDPDATALARQAIRARSAHG